MTAVADQPQSVAPVRRGWRTFATVVALATVLMILGVLALLLITPSRPTGDASAVSAKFLGYTNNAAGTQVVMFSISNRSSIAIRRQWYYEVQVLTNGTWKPQPTVHLRYGHGPVIAPNQSESWTINEPLVEGRWRVWFPYVEYHGPARQMKKWVRRELRSLGLPYKNSEPSYMGLTEEVEPPGAK
jgi:hypothetical protein